MMARATLRARLAVGRADPVDWEDREERVVDAEVPAAAVTRGDRGDSSGSTIP